MNIAQLAGLIRTVLAAVCGGLIAKNIVTTDQISQAAEAISTLISLAIFIGTGYWSYRSNHPKALASQLAVSDKPFSEQVAKTKDIK